MQYYYSTEFRLPDSSALSVFVCLTVCSTVCTTELRSRLPDSSATSVCALQCAVQCAVLALGSGSKIAQPRLCVCLTVCSTLSSTGTWLRLQDNSALSSNRKLQVRARAGLHLPSLQEIVGSAATTKGSHG